MYGDNHKNQDDDEETQRRKKERGKRRFEEDFDHVNEEFFSNFQSRTRQQQADGNAGGQGNAS
jgi:hypothetical protein